MSTNLYTHDVFLSHSSKDKAVVRIIAERLRADGLLVWFDDWELKPGDSIPAKIEQGLEQSRVLVLCISANAFGSDWAALESGTFRFRDPLNRDRRFIPLRLDGASIKGSLAQFLYIDWQTEPHEQVYTKLLEACQPPVREVPATVEQFAGKVIQLDYKGKGIITCVFSLDGKRAITGDIEKTVRVWDVETGRCMRVLKGHTDHVWTIAWSADQCRALSGGTDRTLRLWDLETGQCLRVFSGHEGQIVKVQFSADHRYAFSGSNDQTILVWDLETGRCLRTI
ncbi:MAG: TIR domain-containing protein [Gallionella sp.]|jgi:WD40 repeat protein